MVAVANGHRVLGAGGLARGVQALAVGAAVEEARAGPRAPSGVVRWLPTRLVVEGRSGSAGPSLMRMCRPAGVTHRAASRSGQRIDHPPPVSGHLTQRFSGCRAWRRPLRTPGAILASQPPRSLTFPCRRLGATLAAFGGLCWRLLAVQRQPQPRLPEQPWGASAAFWRLGRAYRPSPRRTCRTRPCPVRPPPPRVAPSAQP